MRTLAFTCFIVLLLLLLTNAGTGSIDSFQTLEAQQLEYDDHFELFHFQHWRSQHGIKVLVNVDGFGAVGDGITDDTQAFIDAWEMACSTPNSVFLVPKGRHYLINATKFNGPCADELVIQIEGTVVAPDDPKVWNPKYQHTWLVFNKLNQTSFQGNGVIDGSGGNWWAASCKKNKSNPCKPAPSAITIESSSAIRVKDLTIQNGQQMNFVIARSESVRIINVKVSAPEDSPNTDGIHITGSINVVLQNCKIGTGDDCISIVNASANIQMKNIYCGPGHGISIGSLGKDKSTGIVENVALDTAFLQGTTNGLRIKTWQGGSGYVRSVLYENVRMDNVSNPIILDQFYCDSPKSCKNQTSAVEIRQIMYRNISGFSRTKIAMKFACSDTVPCTRIFLSNVNLQRRDDTVETYCNSAFGSTSGYIHPSADCLSTSKNKTFILQEKEDHVTQRSKGSLIHTEL